MGQRFLPVAVLILSVSVLGCGYTTASLLPPHLKNIYVADFKNSIPITEEATDRHIYKTYRPRLELDLTKAVQDKYIFDGYLKITKKENADLILEGELIDFRREPTKYGEDDNVDQYRLVIVVKMKMIEVKTGKPLWEEASFAGSTYYYLTGSQAKSESTAVTEAIDDLARRIVDKTIETW